MHQLLQELDQTLALLEAEIPANPSSPQNQRLEDGLASDMRKYFRKLEDAMPMDKITALYYSLVEQE